MTTTPWAVERASSVSATFSSSAVESPPQLTDRAASAASGKNRAGARITRKRAIAAPSRLAMPRENPLAARRERSSVDAIPEREDVARHAGRILDLRKVPEILPRHELGARRLARDLLGDREDG